MRILHVTPYYAPAWSYGGVVQAVTGLAEAQAESGHRVVVLTTDALDRSHRAVAGEQMLNGVRVIRRPNISNRLRSRFNLSTPLGVGQAAARLLRDTSTDIVHCHEFRTMENLLVERHARRARVPIIVSPHGTLSHETGRGLAKKGWDRLLGRRFLGSVALVLALSPAESEQARELWLRAGTRLRSDQVAELPNGTRLLPSSPGAGDQFRREWSLGEGPIVVFVGRLASRKRLGLLVSAFARIASRFPEASLLMVGPDEGWQSRLRSQSRSLGLEGRVTFTGLLSDEDKLAALEAATLFVSPGIGEGFPIAVLEAMACRLPVVVNESVPEIAPSEAAILVPAQEGALAEAMAALLEDGPRRARMGARGRELVATHYTWTRIAARLDDIYRRVIEEAGGRIAGSSEC